MEREPVTDANRGRVTSGPDFSDADFEVVRHEERPVGIEDTVPIQRVRLATDETTEDLSVGGLRKAGGLRDDDGR